MNADLVTWWDSVELWVVQLWFPLQFVVVMTAVVPVCLVAAWAVHRVVDRVSAAPRGSRLSDDKGR